MTLTLNPVPLSLNAPMLERIRYALDTINPEDLYDYVRGLEDIVEAVNRSDLDTDLEPNDGQDPPLAVEKAITDLVARSIESMVYNPYKDFFDDCVGALNGHWPAAEVTDYHLRSVIMGAIMGDAS